MNNKTKKSLALVMIVKNEELGLERAILSCRDFVDEVVIAVDSASVDKTLEIAKKYATTLKILDWQDDFSDARNYAQEGVKTDWVLFLDGHEYVAKHDDVQEHLQSKHDGLMCTVEMETGMQFGNPRIYKTGLQFKGAYHEKQACASTEEYPQFLIKHDRLTGQSEFGRTEREKQRNDQIPRIIGGEYKKNKRNNRALFHLALHAQSIGKNKDAMKWWKRFLKYEKDPAELWYGFFNLSLLHMSLGHYFRAFWYASRSDDVTSGRWETAKLKGMILFQKNKFEKASTYFVDSFSENKCVVSYKPWPRDDSGTYNLIGECLFNLGIYDRASLAFNRAFELCNNDQFKKVLQARSKLMVEMLKDRP